jgi:hypothetical protein
VRNDNDEHSEKQPFPRELTEFGIVKDDNDEHPSKQENNFHSITFATIW